MDQPVPISRACQSPFQGHRRFQAESVPQPHIEASLLEKIKSLSTLDLEIGCGRGLHAIKYCKENPGRTLVAVERTADKFKGLRQRMHHHVGLNNLIAVHADAVSVVSHAIRSHSISRVFILYPNPYPKNKQANLRLHNSPFMAHLLTKTAPTAKLILATNLEWYANEAALAFTEKWGLRLIDRKTLSPQISVPRTHFEKKYLSRGETCLDLTFRFP